MIDPDEEGVCPLCRGAQGHYDSPGAPPHNRGIKGEWVPCNHCEGTGMEWEFPDDAAEEPDDEE